MSRQRDGDEKGHHFLWMARDEGSSSSDDEAVREGRAPRNQSPRTNSFSKTDPAGDKPTARWVIALTGTAAIMLTVGVLMYLSRLTELDAMEKQLTALQDESAASDKPAILRSEIDQLGAQVKGLATRLDAIGNTRDELKALRRELSAQRAELTSMAERLDGLQHAERTARQPAPTPDQANGPGPRESQPTRTSEDGQWVVNLVSVADPSSVREIEQQLAEIGIAPRVETVEMDRRSLQRIVVPGFGSYNAAKQAASRLREQLGLSEEPWISRN